MILDLKTNTNYLELQKHPLRNPIFDYLFVLQVQIFANLANIKSPTPRSHNRRGLCILPDEDVERPIGLFDEILDNYVQRNRLLKTKIRLNLKHIDMIQILIYVQINVKITISLSKDIESKI